MSLVQEIKNIVGHEGLLIDEQDKAYADSDMSANIERSMPYLVVRPSSVQQLISVVQLLIARRIPIVMRGAGTGKSGGAVADSLSVIIDVTRLDRIIAIEPENLLAIVEPGVILAHLKNEVKRFGLFYPPDPASFAQCTIGGNVAENAAGPSTIKYGSTREYLLGGEAVIGTGELISFGKKCPKGVTGFDIAGLLCGSEGCLAVFTRLVLRLLPAPKSVAAAMFFFGDEQEALDAVNALIAQGHLPRTLEYVDYVCLKALAKLYPGFWCPDTKAALIIECDSGVLGSAALEINSIESFLASFKLINKFLATSDEDLAELWRMRSRMSESCTKYLGYKRSEDIAVPLGKIRQFFSSIKSFSKPPNLMCGAFGHAGDGNLHVQIMFNHEKYVGEAEDLCKKVLKLTLSLQGTLTAEHGIGSAKRDFLPLEQSASLIELQKRIKHAFDPYGLLNPNKIFPS